MNFTRCDLPPESILGLDSVDVEWSLVVVKADVTLVVVREVVDLVMRVSSVRLG